MSRFLAGAAAGIALALALAGCGADDRGLNTNELSDLLSISNLSKLAIRSSGDPSQIVGLAIDVDVINVGDRIVDVPFLMTWTLIDDDGNTIGSGTKGLEAGLGPGQRRSVTLSIVFAPLTSLDGVRDVVTFDLIPG